jgi:hypothetical protein
MVDMAVIKTATLPKDALGLTSDFGISSFFVFFKNSKI